MMNIFVFYIICLCCVYVSTINKYQRVKFSIVDMYHGEFGRLV